MDKKEKLEKLKALKESYVAKQKQLVAAKKLEESLSATNIGVLLEAELEQAEVLLAAKDFLAQLQKMAEDIAKMQADSIPLSDSMKETFGPEAAQDFDQSVTEALQDALATIRGAKDTISNSILRAEGKETIDAPIDNDMGADDFASDELDLDDAEDTLATDDVDDVFGGADASAGPVDEPLGRGFKESYKSIGKKLLVNESLDSLVNWLFEDVAATMAPAQFTKFAGQVASKGAQDAERLAGWIGSRKYGAGLGAQLSSPMANLDDDILDESAIKEGKSYRHDDEDESDIKSKKKADNNKRDTAKAKREVEMTEGKSYRFDADDDYDIEDKKKSDKARRDAAKTKREVEVEEDDDEVEAVAEGKSYKANDEDGDSKGRKKSDKSRREAGKAKRTIEEAVRLIIERNIAKGGKGFAAKAIAEAQGMFPMVESDGASIAEAFEAAYGMTPQAYSIKKARAVAEATSLNQTDQKNAATIMANVASDSERDKNFSEKGVQQALNKMKPQERATAQKVINNAKSLGHQVNKVGDLVNATQSEIDGTMKPAGQKPAGQKVQEDVDSPSSKPYWSTADQKPSKKPELAKPAVSSASEKPLSAEKGKAKIKK